jgi:large subunit ribosomal protein L17
VRHRVYGSKLSRDKNQRTALFRSLIRELIIQESITTTQAKAKAIKGLVDRLITKSKASDNASKTVVSSFLTQPEVRKKLSDDILPKLGDRTSGFTEVVRLGIRPGDGTMMVKMSLLTEATSAVKKGSKESDESKGAKDLTTNESEVEAPKKTRKAAKK